MKRCISLLVLCLLVLNLSICASAYVSDRMVDDADLLSAGERGTLADALDTVSSRWGVDVAILTVESLGYKSSTAYADDYYDANFGSNGILLLVSMEDRDWAISTAGSCIQVFTDAGLDHISEQIVPKLSDGDYYGAFTLFAELCDDFLRQASTGSPYDNGNLPKGEFNFGTTLIVCLVIGLVVAFIATGVMRGQLKSVRQKTAAADYLLPGSLQVTEARDLFLYRSVSRQPKPQSNSGSSTHRSSSGVSHGGRSGKF